MIWRGLGFLAVLWFSSSLIFSTPHSPISKLDRRHTERLRKKDRLLAWEGVGEEPNYTDRKKAWSSLNHSILSVSAIQGKIDYLAPSTFLSLSFLSVSTTRSVKWPENQRQKFSKSIWLLVIVQCNVGTVLLPHRCLLPSLYLLYQRFLLAWTCAARSFLSS